MTQTWIIFSINNQKVHQMSYNGYTGKDIVDATKTMVAGQHKVSEQQVKVSFTDEMTDTKKKPSVVSSELVKALKGEMTKNVLKN